jgi:YcxB-like protein
MSLTVKFTPTVDEFLDGQRVYNRFLATSLVRFNYRFYVPVGVFAVSVAAVCLILRLDVGIAFFLLILGGYLISKPTIFWPRKMKKEFAQYPDHKSDKVMEFSEEQIIVQTSHGKSEIAWERFIRFVETDKLFVLYAPPRFLLTVPKRVVPPTESDQFRDLLRRKLAEKAP